MKLRCRWERAAVAVALAAAAAGAAAQAASQPPEAPSSVERGRQLYHSYCARCHGVNMVSPGASFFDLRTLTPREQERFEHSVTHGVRAMPAWGGILKPGDLAALWSYVLAGR